MKLKHPTHDPKPMDALSYYLQVQREYAKPANEGLFCVKDYCNHGHIGSYTLITPQGKLYFAQLRDMILMVV